MRKLSLVLAMVVLPVWLLAQDVPKEELFGGYSHLHTGGQGFDGFDAQFTYNRSDWLGLTGDVSGAYAGQSVNIGGYRRRRRRQRSRPFLHVPFRANIYLP